MMVIGPKTMAMSLDYVAWRITFSRIASRLSWMALHDSFVIDQEARFLAGQCLHQVDLLEGVSGDPNGLRYRPEGGRWLYDEDWVFGGDLIRMLSRWTDNPGQYSCVQSLMPDMAETATEFVTTGVSYEFDPSTLHGTTFNGDSCPAPDLGSQTWIHVASPSTELTAIPTGRQ